MPLLCTAFAACSGGTGDIAAGCETATSDSGWVGAAPPQFQEIWRAGGSNDGEELAMPFMVASGPGGRIAITDLQLQSIGVEPDGSWIGPLTQLGSGPGEVAFTAAATWTDDGGLVVLDLGSAKVVVLDPTERVPAGLIEEFPLDPVAFAPIAQAGQVAGVALDPRGNAYFQKNERGEETTVDQTVVRFTTAGTVDTVATVASPGLDFDWLPAEGLVAPGAPRLVFAVSAGGRVALAGHSDAYRIRVFEGDGPDITICRDVPGLPIRPDELGEGSGPDNPFAEAAAAAPRPEVPAPIGRLFFGRDGRLWVERDRPSIVDPMQFQLGRPGSAFDVFEPDGAYLGEIEAPESARLVAAAGDRVWALETGAFDVTWIVSYRLVRD